MEYKVLAGTEEGIKELEIKVTDHLNKGWKPIGGIAFNLGYPYQAMAIAKKPKKQEIPTRKENADKKPSNISSDDYY